MPIPAELQRALGPAPWIMGVLNATPDSFSDGGRFSEPAAARRRVAEILEHGAHIIDIGAESSRPGADTVSAAEQLRRLSPALEAALAQNAFVSIDTQSAEVAEQCLRRGARMINDVSFLRDVNLARAAAEHGAYLALNHCRVPMDKMSGFSQWPDEDYADIVLDLVADWEGVQARAVAAGVEQDKLIFDPGFGFSKNARHCFELLGRLGEFAQLGVTLMTGPGRKSFIADVDGSSPRQRIGGTVAASLLSAQAGASILRVHDVFEVRQALSVWARAQQAQGED